MTAVAASIILAAVVGGVIFVLLDSWQRREANPTPVAAPEPEPTPAWRPPPPRPSWDTDDRAEPENQGSLWSGWARRP
jgi:hypothetical protein